jgi:hypothetical protein
MSTTTTNHQVNRWLIAITSLCAVGLIALLAVTLLRRPEPPNANVDSLRKDLEQTRKVFDDFVLASDKERNRPTSALADPVAREKEKEERRKLEAGIADFRERFGIIEKKLAAKQMEADTARQKGDSETAKKHDEMKKFVEDQLREIRENFERESQRLAAADNKGAAPMPGDSTTSSSATTVSQSDVVVKNILRLIALGICITNPEIAHIIVAIAAEIGLFGGDTQTATTYSKAVTDIAEGNPIDPETLDRLKDAANQNKVPPAMIGHLDKLIGSVPNGDNYRPSFTPFPKTWDSLKRKRSLVDEFREALMNDPTPESLRKLLGGDPKDPYFPSPKAKKEVEDFFNGPDWVMEKKKFWDGDNGLGMIRAQKEG